jgi:hypothetical protein
MRSHSIGAVLVLVLVSLAPPCANGAAIVDGLEDIEFWAGSGANRAALVLDWNDGKEPVSLAWGYRWDGTARASDMVLALVNADPRLFAKLSTNGSSGMAFYGGGYDLDDDGQFGVSDGTTFDSGGLAVTGPADNGNPTDAADHYEEGWFSEGFWRHYRADTNPFASGGTWGSGPGLSSRVLVDGGWDGLSYARAFVASAPDAPTAAASPVPEPAASSLALAALAAPVFVKSLRRRHSMCGVAAAVVVAAMLMLGFSGAAQAASSASHVVGYASGTLVGNESNDSGAALGVPNGDTSFGALTPFNPPFMGSDIVTVRQGGFIELQLSSPVQVGPGAMLGVFVNNGIIDVSPAEFDDLGNAISGGTGQAGTSAAFFSPAPRAMVSVRGSSGDFVPLGAQPITFDIPTNAYTDTTIDKYFAPLGSSLADPFKPFMGTLSSFDGLSYGQMVSLLNGSAGGTWISLADTGLPSVEYVRFDVPMGANYRLVLDSVSATPAVPEPATATATMLTVTVACFVRRHRRASLDH